MSLIKEENVDQQVPNFSQQLVQAVEAILDPASTQDRRREASQFCEDFKNNSIYLPNCGIYLYNNSTSPIIKHFGLQLVQHAVKFRWNDLNPDDKSKLKMTSLQFVANGGGPLFEEPVYVKDGIAKLAVEIMKREWPQNWPDLFTNLSDISQKGASPLYIVMRVLLRLAEEVTNTDTDMPPVRKKEMMTALLDIIDELFKFFVKTLQVNVNKMKAMRIQFGNSQQKEVVLHKVISECVLTTLCGYVGWVNTKLIVQNNAILLELLCLLLQEEDVNIMAAECLEFIAARKGKVFERKPLLILFNVDAIQIMFSSATSVSEDDPVEKKRIFLKRVCNVLSLIGSSQLATIWGVDGANQNEPPHFNIYIEALLTLYQQKDMLIIEAINKVWLAFFKNEEIAKNSTFQSFLPKILVIAKTKLTKASHPSNKDLSRRYYSETDFGTMAEKQTVWTTVRSNTREIIQEMTCLFPADTFLQAGIWLLRRIHAPETQVPVTETSEDYLEWDSMMFFLNSVCVRLFNTPRISVKDAMSASIVFENTTMTACELGQKCIEALIQFNTTDLLIRPLAFACFENLLHFIEFVPGLLQPVIHKIFEAVSFVSTKLDDHVMVIDFRRHAATIWIRLCLLHSKLMIDILEELTKHIHNSLAWNDFNSQERSLLMEGLIIVSNAYKNFEKQRAYLIEILAPVKAVWMTPEMEHALSSTESLIKFVGLDRNEEDTQCQSNRFLILVCLRYIQGIMKRAEAPKDSQDQINGGFTTRPEDTAINPCTALLLPLLSNVFHLIRVVNNIWNPEILDKISPHYQASLSIHDAERAAIFGLEGSEEKVIRDDKSKGQRVNEMKSFLFKLQENCSLILSDCSRLGEGFYNAPSLGEHLIKYVVNSWKYLPNYRLRVPIRNFLKHFCRQCPPAYYKTALVPVIAATVPFVIEHLNKQWEMVRSRENISVAAEGDPEEDIEENEDKSKEVIENQLVHLITKNFMETFFIICTLRRSEEPTGEAKQSSVDDILQDVAKFFLTDPDTCQIILYTPFFAVQWPDSVSFIKAVKLCVPFIKQIVQNPPQGVPMAPVMFQQLFTLLLKGFQVMGHNAEMQTQLMRTAMIIYDTLRPLFPEMKEILLQVPGAIAETINYYDKWLFSSTGMPEKQKKKVFRNIVNGLIRKEVGKMFSHDITILNLPSLPQKKKASPASLLDSEGQDVGLVQLFQPQS